jgi:hypothetical protein
MNKIKSTYSEFDIVNIFKSPHKNCIGTHTMVVDSDLVETGKCYSLCMPIEIASRIERGCRCRITFFAPANIIEMVRTGNYVKLPDFMKIERLTSGGWSLLYEGKPPVEEDQ